MPVEEFSSEEEAADQDLTELWRITFSILLLTSKEGEWDSELW